ncbi:MAG TPA: hypothetical protein VK463_03770 [Desulfomonilaceae bacterium]|nr:hypothetical protein [Desulfomonilaceae bacterium]
MDDTSDYVLRTQNQAVSMGVVVSHAHESPVYLRDDTVNHEVRIVVRRENYDVAGPYWAISIGFDVKTVTVYQGWIHARSGVKDVQHMSQSHCRKGPNRYGSRILRCEACPRSEARRPTFERSNHIIAGVKRRSNLCFG